jgi:hypothetical protein
MAGYEAKYCARCNGAFECKPGNITQCQCFGITFAEEEKEYIRKTYDDCLCRNCLLNIKYEVRDGYVKSKLKSILSVFK